MDEVSPEVLDAAELEWCRRQCRAGNPFPLIALQWPEMLVTDPDEAQYFEGEIGNPDNPCLRLDTWQRNDIFRPFFDESVSEIAIKGNTKAGKGASVSMAVNLWFDIYPEAKVILTSQRYEHAVDVIFGEVSKWRNRMQQPGPGEILKAGIADTPQHYIKISNPKDGEGFSGQHGPRTLIVFDEATSVPDGKYDDAQKQIRKIVALANPRVLFGWFREMYETCKDKNTTQSINANLGLRHCVTVDGANNCNVRNRRLERPIGPIGGIEILDRKFEHNERIPPEYFAKVKLLIPDQCDYGRFKAICAHRDQRHIDVFGHGHFPEEDEELQVIVSSWLAFHQAAWNEDLKVECFGLDVSASLDGDETVLTAGGALGIAKNYVFQDPDTMRTVAWVMRTAEACGIQLRFGRVPVTVDMDGLGKGVGDRLRELGVWVLEFRGGTSSQVDPSRYVNLRTEAYGELGRRLNPRGPWGRDSFALPPDTMLAQELCAPEKIFSGNDAFRFGITPKRRPPGTTRDDVLTIKDKIGRSPDRGDSAVMMFHAVRELGLWSSWTADLAKRDVAYPTTDGQVAAMREQVEKDLKSGNVANKETADLLNFLRQASTGRINYR